MGSHELPVSRNSHRRTFALKIAPTPPITHLTRLSQSDVADPRLSPFSDQQCWRTHRAGEARYRISPHQSRDRHPRGRRLALACRRNCTRLDGFSHQLHAPRLLLPVGSEDRLGCTLSPTGLITLSYYAIPLILVYFIGRNRNLPFNWIFWTFGGFILPAYYSSDGNLERLARQLPAGRHHPATAAPLYSRRRCSSLWPRRRWRFPASRS